MKRHLVLNLEMLFLFKILLRWVMQNAITINLCLIQLILSLKINQKTKISFVIILLKGPIFLIVTQILHLRPKSWICLNFGHKSCTWPNNPNSKALEKENNVSIVKFFQPNVMHKSIKVHHVPLTVLVNTGSDAMIFNIHAYCKLGSPALKNYSGMFTAFDNLKIKKLVYFEVLIMTDD